MTRNTKQRGAITRALAQAARPLLPQEILEAAQEDVANLNLATVYRNLNLLVDEGQVVAVRLPGLASRFEVAGHHHHHFLCRQCERIYDIHACSAEISRLAPPGFEVADHEVILYGRCAACQHESSLS